MNRRTSHGGVWLVSLLTLSLIGSAAAQTSANADWRQPYTGADATGPNVLALWHFDADDPTADASGHGHTLTLRGESSRFVPEGRFGGALESFPGFPPDDVPNGVSTPDHPDLTPKGAFTIEMWFQPKPELAERVTSYLLDKKYTNTAPHHDYQLLLRKAGTGKHRLQATLGFGEEQASYSTDPIAFESGRWYHVAFVYDGAGGGTIYLDGEQVGQANHPGRGPVSDGPRVLALGARVGSNYYGCPVYIDEVRISNEALSFWPDRASLDLQSTRTVFRRMEQDARLQIRVVNDRPQPLSGAVVTLTMADLPVQRITLPQLQPGERHQFTHSIDTRLSPGRYTLTARIEPAKGEEDLDATISTPITIVPRPASHRLPVVMWGSGDPETLKQIGFTHALVWLGSYSRVWNAKGPVEADTPDQVASNRRMLDEMLAVGVQGLAYTYPGRWVGREMIEQFGRVDRQGEPAGRANVCCLFPEIQDFGYRMGAAIGETYGDLPALAGALVHSEVRDGTQVCFHQHDRAAFRAFAGSDIPDAVTSKGGVLYRNIPGFPADHIVADDDPILRYYQWFWKDGDGWNPLHSQVSAGLKSTARDDFWTFFDPAVRAPSRHGSGGNVDYISQWTYTYPDPLKIGLAADQLFAMADGNDAQDVMSMTQVIWYRSQTAPQPKQGQPPIENAAAWETQQPEAKFITIAPDHLREALWLQLARPIKGLMYHGWGSLVEVPGSTHAYKHTNPAAAKALTELIANVVEPLGPTLVQVPDRPSDVAYLESFASQMFAGRGTHGWGNGWGADAYLVLRYAQLQPRILYEETLLAEGLDRYKVLVLVHCDVLPASVAAAVQSFQDRGGIVVADEYLAPALQPDILLPSYDRSGEAREDKAALQAAAQTLRQQLDPHYQRPSDASNPDVLTRVRRFGESDYLFAINDHRTFGSYVGQHGRVMEKGLPSQATISLVRSGEGVVYDLTTAQRIEDVAYSGDQLSLNVDLGPGEGRLFLVTPQPIAAVQIEAPAAAKSGASVAVRVRVVDQVGRPIDAVVPVELRILDAAGKLAEFSGYHGARAGELSLTLDLPTNAAPGPWRIEARDLAAGRTVAWTMQVTP